MKIYTKTGDKGTTSLFNGKRVSKDNPLIDLLGELDSINSHVGLLLSVLNQKKFLTEVVLLYKIQSILFSIGTEVAYPKKHKELKLLDITETLEKHIDEMDKELKPLKNFILPGGSYEASIAHVLRTTTRSVERKFINKKKSYNSKDVGIFLNRLSDYFFTLARLINHKLKVPDSIWKK